MALTAGTRLGPYEILGLMGAGGMGEVYKAKDTRLDRTVAIKVLPASLSDPEHRARFEREARTIAGLSHPHICTLHDVGEHASSLFLVMEHLTGQTLADRLTKGALPLDEALQVGAQIADALSAAHRAGIIHRDLKPGNIMLTKLGVKLLDFGLAKLKAASTPAFAPAFSQPTRSQPLTGRGTILGTLQYMAPEQLDGKDADARSDIWALGLVLYEMVTGKRAFEATSEVSLIGAILEREPTPLNTLQPLTPPALDRVVRQCLAKIQDDRPDTAHDVANDLRWIRETITTTTISRSRRRPRIVRTTIVVAGVVLLIAVGFGIRALLGPPTAPPLVSHVIVDLRPADVLSGTNALERLVNRPTRTAIALSPDGRLLVFAASKGQEQRLYARALERDEAWAIKGTEHGEMPFFSPDGRWIGFWADGVLRKVPTEGGLAVDLCKTTEQPTGAAWGAGNQIIFDQKAWEGLWQVSDRGGTPKPLTTIDLASGEFSHRLPHVLPGGEGVLYTAVSSDDIAGWTTMVRIAATGEQKKLLERAADARYVSTGHLLFVRTGTLLAVPFDLSTLRITGGEFAVADDVMQAFNTGNGNIETGAGQAVVADNGTLAYVRGGIVPDSKYTLATVDIKGTIHKLTSEPEPHPYIAPQLSSDRQRVVAQNLSASNAGLWIYDLRRGFLSRPVAGLNAAWPIWTPDGRWIVFAGSEKGPHNLFRVRADGTGTPERLTRSPFHQLPACWGLAGRELVFLEAHNDTGIDIMVMPVGQPQNARALVQTRFNEVFPAVSPDGRWLAYTSSASGRDEVYIQPYVGGDTVRVSADGGRNPLWSHDGRRLFFCIGRENTWRVYSVDLVATDRLVAAPPKLLFEMPDMNSKVVRSDPLHAWDLMPDGTSFLVVTVTKEERLPAAPREVNVVLNWFEELEAKVPGK